MALITIATDDMNEAQRMLRALMDPTKATDEVVVTTPGGAEPTPAAEQSRPRGRAPRAGAPAPEPSGSPASEAPALPPMPTPAPLMSPLLPTPPMPLMAPPPAPIPAPAPVAAPPSAPPPPEPPAGDSAAAPGWTLEHVKTLATTFLRDPRGGPERLKPILDKHGIMLVPNTPPHLWHIVYGEMQAVLEAS